MSKNFNSALAKASKQSLNETHNRYETEEDSRIFEELSANQESDLGQRILALPDDDIAILFFHYSFGISYDDISDILELDTVKGKLRYIEQVLSSGMGLSGGWGISKDSMCRACKIALDEYTKAEGPDVIPIYSRQFIRKMRELGVVRTSSSIYVKMLQKVAIILVILGISFGAALGVYAEFRERVFRWFTETFPQFSEFILASDLTDAETSFGELLRYRPEFIPDGYFLDFVFELHPSVYFNYVNSDGEMLTIIGRLPDISPIALNTESAEVEITSFRGEDAFFWTLDGISHYVFILDGYHFSIIGRIEKESIVQIAESLEIL